MRGTSIVPRTGAAGYRPPRSDLDTKVGGSTAASLRLTLLASRHYNPPDQTLLVLKRQRLTYRDRRPAPLVAHAVSRYRTHERTAMATAASSGIHDDITQCIGNTPLVKF